MRKRLFSIMQYIIFLGGGLFLVWWQLKSMTAEQKTAFIAAFQHANYWLLFPVIIAILLGHVSRAMRWKLMMEPLGYDPALKNVFAVTMIGYFANAAIPRLGEILKCTFLARYEHLKVDKLVGTIIIERAFDFFCYLVFICITILIQIDLIGDYVQGKLKLIALTPGLPLWGKLLIILFVLLVILLFTKFLLKRFPENKIIIKVNGFINGMMEGFRSIATLKRRKAFLLHTLFIWSMYLLEIYMGFYAMEGTAHLSIKAGFSVLSLATLAMIITPGGIGSFPIFVMETLLIYNISPTLGIAFGWLMWGIFTGIIIIAGILALLLLPYMNKNKMHHEVSTADPIQDT
ncbi:MAG: lysylphosphatidylglycerol synthase transmembrane domain-containing protein [Ferruginibacter sp.]